MEDESLVGRINELAAAGHRLYARESSGDATVPPACDRRQPCVAQLRIYPDSGHGFLDQYPTLLADHVNAFLNGG